jgi:hypothetical protein
MITLVDSRLLFYFLVCIFSIFSQVEATVPQVSILHPTFSSLFSNLSFDSVILACTYKSTLQSTIDATDGTTDISTMGKANRSAYSSTHKLSNKGTNSSACGEANVTT